MAIIVEICNNAGIIRLPKFRGDYMDILSLSGNICSIAGLILSIWLFIQTGRIKKSVDNALNRRSKITNYMRMRQGLLQGITDCAKFLINEHTYSEQLPKIQKLDSCLADLLTYHPSLDSSTKKKIDEIRSALLITEKRFSFVEIITPLNDIISILKEEAMYYD